MHSALTTIGTGAENLHRTVVKGHRINIADQRADIEFADGAETQSET